MDPLTYEWSLKNSAGTLIRSATTAAFNPLIPKMAVTLCHSRFRDGDGGVTTDTRNIVGVNAAPVVNVTGPSEINEGSTVAIDADLLRSWDDAPWEYRWEVVSDNGRTVNPVTGTLPKTGAVPRFNYGSGMKDLNSLQLSVSDGVNTTTLTEHSRQQCCSESDCDQHDLGCESRRSVHDQRNIR